MENQVYLVKPTADLKPQYLAFYQEWVESGEHMVPWVISKDPSDFQAMMDFLSNEDKAEGLPEGWVAASTFWLVDEQQEVVGAVNIRHSLTERLFNEGGHIGYGIRPSARRKGYATKLLALALEKAKGFGIEKALVVCDATNVASEKTILNNGGVRDTDFMEEDGNVIRRFWIDL
ncbi:MAG TPA: GNAT family N-acetyltransferase [Bacilli bacterium]|nr:GNAT family N-acetyltransferase [Bacilli bacterium]